MTDFVHLNVHSDYSLLGSTASVKELITKTVSLGMKHLALTDSGNMFGVLNFQKECAKQGIHPIIGCEFYFTSLPLSGDYWETGGNFNLILLAVNEEGYRNLGKLSSCPFTKGSPHIDKDLLIQYHSGLIGISGCLGEDIVLYSNVNNIIEGIEERALLFRSILGNGNFYLELQDQHSEVQKVINPVIIDISQHTGIPLAATNSIHYIEKKDAVAHDVLYCIDQKKTRGQQDRTRLENNEFYFKSGDEMAALFPDHPEAIINTVRIAERCSAVIPQPGPQWPDFDIPQGFDNADDYIRHLTLYGLKKRYPGKIESIMERAEYELSVIIQSGFSNYFLIVADIVYWAGKHHIPVGPCRGAGSSSIVAYALGITSIDPIQYKLLFERFINPERLSVPNFDIDFSCAGREQVVKYVTEKYGRNRVGQIVAFGTFSTKTAIKDIVRVLDTSIDEADKIAQKLEGKCRHISYHAAGIIIGKTDLSDYVPLYHDHKTGIIASQFTSDQLEDCGLVKFDFLGLKTLDIIKNTEELIRKRGGHYTSFSINAIPIDDKPTFDILSEGDTSGVFHFESEEMQNILKQTKLDSITDLIALSALYHPGQMEYIPLFIDRKHSRQSIEYPDPSLEDILKETYGIIVYQEQVMLIIQRIAGYSLAQADSLRRILMKRNPEEINTEKERFISTAKKQRFKERDAERIFEILIPATGMTFNKGHALACSLLAYQTAYLKAHFPDEFSICGSTD
jgi:DNA polymerase-3 subunit alpha